MRGNYKGLLIIAAAGMLLAAGVGAAGYAASVPLERETALAEENLARVSAFTEDPWREPFENQAVKAENTEPAEEEDWDASCIASYTSPEGIRFLSMSMAWDQGKLQDLYQELLQNKHGEELNTLSYVLIYPQQDEYAAATHQNMVQTKVFTLRHPALPERLEVPFTRVSGVITLYDGDRCDTVESMASNLSHEYGHHFTFYHMFGNTVDERALLESEYARLRGLDPEKVQCDRMDAQFYLENHHWYLSEIAAEDYVTLMGSPNSREVGQFYDIRDRVNGAAPQEEEVYALRNARVQENLMIPMASEVAGLRDYFYSFVEGPAPELPQKQPISLEIQRNSVGFDFVAGYQELANYELTWNKAYGEEAVYTLVCFQEEAYSSSFYPIRTVSAGQDASAFLGTIWSEGEDSVSYWDDGLASGTRTFVVTAVLPDGTLYTSDPLTYTF